MGVWPAQTANVTGMAQPEEVHTLQVSDGVLETLRVPPALGRWFDGGGPGPARREDRDAELWLLAAAFRRGPRRDWPDDRRWTGSRAR